MLKIGLELIVEFHFLELENMNETIINFIFIIIYYIYFILLKFKLFLIN
jgi:hypothetical protein